MSATSLIRPLRQNGGTIFVFTSAANDIARTFSDDNFRFTFSKFAALELPKQDIPTNNNENYLIFQALGNRANVTPFTNLDTTVIKDMVDGQLDSSNAFLAESFQNYLLNWENLILNQENSNGDLYDNSTYQTVTERIFWKWLIDIGAIRFDNATSTDATDNGFFVEEIEDNGSLKDKYSRVVKYLGDITLINNVNRGGEAYSQVYLHIPSEHGHTPSVLFKNLIDKNYSPSLYWTGTNGDDIEGRTSHPVSGMSITAYFEDQNTRTYNAQNVFGDITNTTVEISTDANGTSTFPIKISNMDGVVIDWNPQNYTKIANNPSIQTVSELNTSAEADDFKFNTILIYYDVYDVSNPTNVKRNLYGVLFIDDFEETISDGATLKSFPKFKPNPITKLNGNAYSLKTNIKFDTSADNVGVERSINEYSTFSMDLFSDAMVSLQNCLEYFSTQQIKLNDITDKVDNLEKFFFSQATIDELRAEVNALETSVQNALIALESPSTLLELIRNNSNRINSLASGQLNTQLSYDLNPFVQGEGIKIDKSVPNKVRIINTVQDYSLSYCYNTSKSLSYLPGNGITDITDIVNYPIKNNIILLNRHGNYYKNSTASSTNITNDVKINIDDTRFKFRTGQSFKIYFENDFVLDTPRSLYIYSDAVNRFNIGNYKWLVGKLVSTDFIGSKPIIEIICTDEVRYTFDVHVIR